MAAKNSSPVLPIFGMLIAAGLILLALVISAQAQDFEPDRRPEEDLFLAMPFNDGSVAPKSTSFTTAPTSSGWNTTLNNANTGAFVIGQYSSGNAPYYYADRAEWKTPPLTISGWARLDYQPLNANTAFFGNGQWGGSYDTGYISFRRDGGVYSGIANYTYAIVGYNNSATYYVGGWFPVPVQWDHLVAVVTPTTITCYLNGVSLGTNSFTSYGRQTGSAFNFWIGGSNQSSGGQSLDDLRVYANRALTASEVMSIFQSGRTQQGSP